MPIKIPCTPLALTSQPPFVRRQVTPPAIPTAIPAPDPALPAGRRVHSSTAAIPLQPRNPLPAAIRSTELQSRQVPSPQSNDRPTSQRESASVTSRPAESNQEAPGHAPHALPQDAAPPAISATAPVLKKPRIDWANADLSHLSRDTPPPAYVSTFLQRRGQRILAGGSGRMLEVGFEDGSGVRAFLEAGWKQVHAVEVNPACRNFIEDEIGTGKVSLQMARIQDAHIPSDLDVIHTHFVLSFLEEPVEPTLMRYLAGLRDGGHLLGGVLGRRHPDHGSEGLRAFDRDEFTQILQACGFVHIATWPIDEVEADGSKPCRELRFRACKPAALRSASAEYSQTGARSSPV